jgi:hypothetical protein
MTENETQDKHDAGPSDPEAVEEPQTVPEDQPLISSNHIEGERNIDIVTESSDGPASLSRLTPGAIFFGTLVSLGLVGFVLLARVTVHFNDQVTFEHVSRKMRVIDVWDRLRNHLPDVAHPTILGIVYDISIALVVVGSLACIWLALMATSNSSSEATPAVESEPPSISDAPALQIEH